MDPDIRSSIENYIEKLREELIQEIQEMNSEIPGDTASSFGLVGFESPVQERLCCSTANFNACAK